MIDVQRHAAERCLIRVSPNRSLSTRECIAAFSIIACACLAVAGTFAWRGLWVPLPFAGAEVLALGSCLAWVMRQGRRFDTIDLSCDRVAVRSGGVGGDQRIDFHPLWMRVELRPGRYSGYPQRLLLASHGREFEVGKFLNDAERSALFGELTRSLRSVNNGADGSPRGAEIG